MTGPTVARDLKGFPVWEVNQRGILKGEMTMVAAISTLDNGIVEAMYANEPAWHGLGEIFDAGGDLAPDSETAMRLAHLDWSVGLERLQIVGGQFDGKEVGGSFANVRQDTGAVLGVVGDRYKPLQNAEAFAFLDSLLQDGIMRYEAAMALNGGRKVVLLARMPSVDDIAEGDRTLRYIFLSTAHDGSGAVTLSPTAVRVVCANTLRLAEGKAHRAGTLCSVRHTASMDTKLEQVRKYLSLFDEQFTGYAESARRLAATKYTKDQARQYIDELFPVDADATARQMGNHDRKIQAVRNAFVHPSNSLPAVKGTFWQLFNAVTFAADHAPELNRYKGSQRDRAENAFVSKTEGRNADLKDRAFRLALEMAV